jgi:putative transposase
MVMVTAASRSDQAGARQIFKRRRGTGKKLRKVWVDGTYRGAEWTAWVKERYPRVLASVARAEGQKGFAVLPHRWVVERTLAWLNQSRRLSKDDAELPTTSETFVDVAMTRLMLKRLAA